MIDIYSMDTIRNMLRYIDDDQRIARHVGCPVESISRIRADEFGPHRLPSYAPRPRERSERLDLAGESWMKSARAGSRKLAEVLARAGA